MENLNINQTKSKKKSICLLVIGPHRSGKTTLVYKLLEKLNKFYDSSYFQSKFNQLKLEGVEEDKIYSSMIYSNYFEKIRGMSIDMKHDNITTDNYEIDLIDTPGNFCFFKNSIKGAMISNYCLFVISSEILNRTSDRFNKDITCKDQNLFSRAIEKEIEQKLILAYGAGIKQLVIVININKNENLNLEKYNQIKSFLEVILKKVGYINNINNTNNTNNTNNNNNDEIKFIPLSAMKNINIFKNDFSLNWYTGPCLIEAINAFKFEEKIVTDQSMCFPSVIMSIIKFLKIDQNLYLFMCKLQSGTINMLLNQKKFNLISHYWNEDMFEFLNVQKMKKDIFEVETGDIIGIKAKRINLPKVSKELQKKINCNFLISNYHNDRSYGTQKFTCYVTVVQQPQLFKLNVNFQIFVGSSKLVVRVENVMRKYDINSKEDSQVDPINIEIGDKIFIKFSVVHPRGIVLFSFREIEALGRIIIKNGNLIVGYGIIEDVEIKSFDTNK